MGAGASSADTPQALIIKTGTRQKLLKRDIVIADEKSYTERMSNMIYLTFIFAVILGIMLFSGLVKTVKFGFKADPTENIYQSEAVKQTQSERAAEVAEKNRELMDRVRAQMEKNKR